MTHISPPQCMYAIHCGALHGKKKGSDLFFPVTMHWQLYLRKWLPYCNTHGMVCLVNHIQMDLLCNVEDVL